MIGLDTGYFIELMNGNEEASALWKSCLTGDGDLVVSCMTIFEIERLGLQGTLQDWESVLDAINAVTMVVWLDRQVLSRAALLSRGLGIPAIDSLILAGLISNDCDTVYTTDAHLQKYQSDRVRIRNLRESG
jgi:predicted nucleic acid-binding protein